MRAGIVVNVTPGDRRRLEAIAGNRNAPQKNVWRAKIILATDEGCGTAEIMRRSGKAKRVVWRWQARFMAEGVAGLTRDKMRKPGKPPLPVVTGRAVDLASSRHVEHSHAQILWFRREPWRRPQNSFRGGRPLLPQPLH